MLYVVRKPCADMPKYHDQPLRLHMLPISCGSCGFMCSSVLQCIQRPLQGVGIINNHNSTGGIASAPPTTASFRLFISLRGRGRSAGPSMTRDSLACKCGWRPRYRHCASGSRMCPGVAVGLTITLRSAERFLQ